MRIPTLRGPFAFALLLVFAACEQTDPTPQAVAVSPALDQALGNIEFSREPGYPMPVLEERVRVAVDAMYNVANHADTWEEAHDLALREIAQAEPGVIRRTVEQSVSKVLLVGYLVPNREDARTSALALDYTRRLVDRKSPEAEAMLTVVQTFGSSWDPAERRKVALGAADAVEAHVRGGTSCRDCDLPAEMRRSVVESGGTTDVVDLRRLDAARQLRALAG